MTKHLLTPVYSLSPTAWGPDEAYTGAGPEGDEGAAPLCSEPVEITL